MKESAPEIHRCLPQGTRGAGGGGDSSAPGAQSRAGRGRGDGGARRASEPGSLKWLIRKPSAGGGGEQSGPGPAVAAAARSLAGSHPAPPGAPGGEELRGPRAAHHPPAGAGRTPRDNKGAHAAMTLGRAGTRGAAPGPPRHQPWAAGAGTKARACPGAPPPAPPAVPSLARAQHRASHVSGGGGGARRAGDERGAAGPPTPPGSPCAPETAMLMQKQQCSPRARTAPGQARLRSLPAPQPPAGTGCPPPRGVRPGPGSSLPLSQRRRPAPGHTPPEPADAPRLEPPQLPKHLDPGGA